MPPEEKKTHLSKAVLKQNRKNQIGPITTNANNVRNQSELKLGNRCRQARENTTCVKRGKTQPLSSAEKRNLCQARERNLCRARENASSIECGKTQPLSNAGKCNQYKVRENTTCVKRGKTQPASSVRK